MEILTFIILGLFAVLSIVMCVIMFALFKILWWYKD